MKKFVILFFVVLLCACTESGPQKTLNNLAQALEKKDSDYFVSQIDMPRFAAAQINNMTKVSEPLRALDAVGRMLGLGGMEHLIGAVRDMQAKENERFMRGVGTGELMLMCKEAKTPDCPWVPQSLREAEIFDITEGMAVAQITTPTNISSWLALTKIGDSWKVVGQSPLKSDAENFAQGKKRDIEQASPMDVPAPPPPPKQKTEEPQEPVRF